MSIELIIFLAMIATFALGCFAAKLPVSVSMMAAAIVGALVGGQGFPLRHFVEGTFSYVDTILVIATAMIFMKALEASGAMDALCALIIEKFYKVPALLLILVMLVIMFPGMVTGSSTAAVLSAGSIVAPILIMMGIPAVVTASIIAMGGLLGMIAPPTNIPVMIIGGGIDMPYVGFEGPLALLTFPLAILFVLLLGYKYVRKIDIELIRPKLDTETGRKYGFRIYLPVLLVLILMLLDKVVPQIPDLGTPLIFILGAVCAMFTGKRFNPLKAAKEAVNTVLPVLGILMGVGMFIQIMTLTGVRGLIVTTCLSLPQGWLYVALAISVPLFGAISSFGSSSVLGVPFMLAMLSGNQIVTAAAISLIASLGDMMPPTALAGMFAAQIVHEDNYFLVLKKCLVPALILILYAIAILVFSPQIGSLLGV